MTESLTLAPRSAFSAAFSTLCDIETLPDELLKYIFSFLPKNHLTSLNLVNWRWRHITQDVFKYLVKKSCPQLCQTNWAKTMTVKRGWQSLYSVLAGSSRTLPISLAKATGIALEGNILVVAKRATLFIYDLFHAGQNKNCHNTFAPLKVFRPSPGSPGPHSGTVTIDRLSCLIDQRILITAYRESHLEHSSVTEWWKMSLLNLNTEKPIRLLDNYYEKSCFKTAFNYPILVNYLGSTLKVWDIEQRQFLNTFTLDSAVVTCVSISHDKIVTGNTKGEVHLWDLRSGAGVHKLSHVNSNGISDVLITSKWLISASHILVLHNLEKNTIVWQRPVCSSGITKIMLQEDLIVAACQTDRGLNSNIYSFDGKIKKIYLFDSQHILMQGRLLAIAESSLFESQIQFIKVE